LVGYLQRIAHAVMGDMEKTEVGNSRAVQLQSALGKELAPGEIFFHEYSSSLSLFAQRIARVYSRCILALTIDLRVRIALELKTLLHGRLAADSGHPPVTAEDIATPFLSALAEFCDASEMHPLWGPAFNYILGGVERQLSVSLLQIFEEHCGLDGIVDVGEGLEEAKKSLALSVVGAADLIEDFFAPHRRRALEKLVDGECGWDVDAEARGERPYDVSVAAKIGYSGGLEEVRTLYNMLYAPPE